MGLVVALRFLLWGASIGALTGFFLMQGAHFPHLLRYLSLPMILSFYLLGTGHFLFILRLSDWRGRLLALVPAVGIFALTVPVIATSPRAITLSLGASLAFYLWAAIRQAGTLSHLRTVSWIGLTAKATLFVGLLALLLPSLAAQLAVFGGLALLLATTIGWQIWLAELRQSIAEREAI